jgi:hypothetical protein
MNSVRALKLKKIFNLKEYLQEKAREDRAYREYVEQEIKKAEEDIAAGRVYTLEEFKDLLEEKIKFKPISEEETEEFKKDIKYFETKIKELNITEQTRKKKKTELTEEEQDKLYDEYVYKSLIDGSISAIEDGMCDLEPFLKELEATYEVTRN